MTKNVLLPADTYTVVNKTVLDDRDKKIITMLYQPIIGYAAVSLYFTLIDDLDKREVMSGDLTHHHLMNIMQLKLQSILIAREKLEAVGLLKTYFKEDNSNNYVYVLFSPLSVSEFFNHPILNVVLYNNIGKIEYEKIVHYFKIPRIVLKDYKDITKNFNEVFSSISSSSFDEYDDLVARNNNNILVTSKIDFELLISAIPKRMISDRCFSDEVKTLINNLSFVYHIDNLNMEGLVRNSINEKGLIDKNELRKSARNFYQFENSGKLPSLVYSKQPEYLTSPKGNTSNWAKMVYTFENITPYDYLKSKYKDGNVSSRDLKLVEGLLVDFKLKPGVVNVLLAYVLQINNQKLNKTYVETIAGQWKRLNIETVDEAMKVSEKEHKKLKKQLINKPVSGKVKEESVPIWFDKDIDKENISEKEKEELDELLSEFA